MLNSHLNQAQLINGQVKNAVYRLEEIQALLFGSPARDKNDKTGASIEPMGRVNILTSMQTDTEDQLNSLITLIEFFETALDMTTASSEGGPVGYTR